MKNLLLKYWQDGLILLGAVLVGAILVWVFKPNKVVTEQVMDTTEVVRLNKQIDSFGIEIAKRDKIELEMVKRQFVTDSLLIMNHKGLKKDYAKISNLNDSTRALYIDSVLKRAGIR